jgi:selenocysteine lyase/cysteine desulfurase
MDVAGLRAQTPGCAHRVHLNNAGAALMAEPTLEAMRAHLTLEAEIGGYEAADAAHDSIVDAYRAVAELVGARSQEIAFFDNATHAWNAAFYSVPFRRGDRILTGRSEYGSNVLAYLQMAERIGVEVIVVPNDEHGQIDVGALADLVDERTRLIGVSHVPTSGGLVNPAAEVGRIARQAGVLFLLDATQSVGQFPVDVEDIGCDMLTSTGRKFLRGPRGTGFLWVRSAANERLDPFVAEIQSATWDGRRRSASDRSRSVPGCGPGSTSCPAYPRTTWESRAVRSSPRASTECRRPRWPERSSAPASTSRSRFRATPSSIPRSAGCIRSFASRPTTTTPTMSSNSRSSTSARSEPDAITR